MKRIGMLASTIVIWAAVSAVSAQQEAPAGASDRGPADRSMKTRSAELERVKRDAGKPDPQPVIPPVKFQEIKEDFESLQLKQDEIRKIYSEGKQVDMVKIGTVAGIMNASAIRLHGNLFPPPVEEPKPKKKSKEQKVEPAKVEPALEPLPQDLRSMIVAQDDALAAFVANPMFTNPQVSNVDSNVKAQGDLKKLIRLTAALGEMAAQKPQ
jgi:hypothetical protein